MTVPEGTSAAIVAAHDASADACARMLANAGAATAVLTPNLLARAVTPSESTRLTLHVQNNPMDTSVANERVSPAFAATSISRLGQRKPQDVSALERAQALLSAAHAIEADAVVAAHVDAGIPLSEGRSLLAELRRLCAPKPLVLITRFELADADQIWALRRGRLRLLHPYSDRPRS